MTYPSPSRPNAPALLAIAALHAALFGALLAQRYRVAAQQEGAVVAPIQWLLPLAAPKPSPDKVAPQPAPRLRTATRTAPPATGEPAPPAPITLPAQAATPAAAPDPFDLANTPTTPLRDALLRRQDWGAGKADHDLRGGKLAKLVRPTDTLQAGLERAFREAGEAVPPKWFSAPEIREMSVPESAMRMYKIRTFAGTFCFYKPDPGQQAGYDYKMMTCPRER